MTTPPTSFPEFASIREATAQIGGVIRGLRASAASLPAKIAAIPEQGGTPVTDEIRHMVTAAERLPTQVAALDGLVARAFDQVATLTAYAHAMELRARRDLAARTADRDALRLELEQMREAARAALR